MLRIRESQISVFRGLMLDRFVERMIAHVGEVFPDERRSMEAEELDAFVRKEVEAAAGYGIEQEKDVALYIDLVIGLGENYADRERLGWISRTLEDEHLSGSAKIEQIYGRLGEMTQGK